MRPKRLISLLVAVCMMITMLPFQTTLLEPNHEYRET